MMDRFAQLCLSGLCLQGVILAVLGAWSVTVPREIEGMEGSCLVIPCRFSYTDYPPNDKSRVVWYQYARSGYPLVYDRKNQNDVIKLFRWTTSLYGDPNAGDCSLKINPLRWDHSRQKIYPWVDPDYVTYRYFPFYDETAKITVRGKAIPPQIKVTGPVKFGERITVKCSTYHRCPDRLPTLTLSPQLGTSKIIKTTENDRWKITLEQSWTVENEHQPMSCTVQHPGGQKASAYTDVKAACSFMPVTLSPTSEEFLEGVEKRVTCSVSYTCPKDHPSLTWSYGNMRTESSGPTKLGTGSWRTQSILTFKAGANDHGRSLTCTARFPSGQTQTGTIILQVKRGMFSLGWSFLMPGYITGLRGSCLVIPCRFEYSTSLPSDVRVKWYKYEPGQYPVVYDDHHPGDVIPIFRGKTSLYGSARDRNCSLKISPLEDKHSGLRLYTWVDPKPISSYHRQNYQDKTVQLHVTDRVDKPEIVISNITRVGETISVQCTAYHSCPAAPPTLSLVGLPGTGKATETEVQDGKWKTTLVQTWVIEEDHQTVTCRVKHPGGQQAEAGLAIYPECPAGEISIGPTPEQFLEGVVENITCSVSHICSKKRPILTWNYKDMHASSTTVRTSPTAWTTVSSVMFIASMDDNDKALTCTAEFPDGKNVKKSVNLYVKKYEPPESEKPIDEPDRENMNRHCDPAICEEWTADVVSEIKALTGSCVVIPCTFTYPGIQRADSQLRGTWFREQDPQTFIYDDDQSRVEEGFRGRTRLVGRLGEKNCSMEIDKVKHNDSQEYCFRTKIHEHDQFYKHSCTTVTTFEEVPEPKVNHHGDPVEGSPHIVTCTIYHTCPSHLPKLTWSGRTEQEPIIQQKDIGQGKWEIMSILTFIPKEEDDHNDLTCTVEYHGIDPVTKSVRLYVKRNRLCIFNLVISAVVIAAVYGVLLLSVRSKCKRPQGNYSNLDVGYRSNNETGSNVFVLSATNPTFGVQNDYFNCADDGSVYGNV